ncbi:MAG: M60 family metallopeptidase [Planctomycetaceae bacterium]
MLEKLASDSVSVKWLSSLRSRTRRSIRSRRQSRTTEVLEARQLLSAAPVAAADRVSISADETVVLNFLLANDSDPDGDALAIVGHTQTSNGTLLVNGNGQLEYTPNALFVGVDSFQYTVADGIDGTDTGVVTITVNSVIDPEAARDTILNGVSTIHSGVQPGRMFTYGPQAYDIANYNTTISEGPVIAAASWGAGRVVAVPDHQMLNMDTYGSQGNTGQFYKNSLEWLTGSASTSISIVADSAETASWLISEGYANTVSVSEAGLISALTTADVFVGWLGSAEPQANLDALAAFTVNGGGLLLSEYGVGYDWWWSKPQSEAPGNQLLRDAGIGFPSGNRWDTGLISVSNRGVGQFTAADLLAILADSGSATAADLEHASALMSGLLTVLPEGDSLRAQLQKAYDDRIQSINPTPATPVTDPFEKSLLTEEMNRLKDLPADQVTAHRTAAAVYGDIPAGAPRVTQTVSLDTSVSRWLATGLYAAPGELVTVTVPANLVGQGYRLQVSGHVDNISSRSSWDRVPFGVARSYPIDSTSVQIAGAFGGAIYVDVGATPPDPGLVNIEISGAIQAPLFHLGVTSDNDWVNGIRDLPAPYAEFISDGLAFSLPSAWIRGIDNPTAIMTYWDQVVAVQDYVAAQESLRTGPERINVDVQISTGLLHAGYPIQGPTWASSGLVDYQQLISSGDWGYFHELGHEMQRRADKAWGWNNYYTFSDGVEVTVNIFANAALEAMVPDAGLSGWGWSANPVEVMNRAFQAVHDSAAPTFSDRNQYPYYFQLADGFGFETYRAVLAGYNSDFLNDPSKLPSTAQEEKDQWLIRWSAASGYNMVRYMVTLWGLEVSQSAIDAVTAMNLPEWMPLIGQDDDVVVQSSQPTTFQVLSNDLTLDSSASVVSFTQPSAGTLVDNGGGSFTYTPAAGQTGDVTFSYTVSNSTGQTSVQQVRLGAPRPFAWWKLDETSGSVAADSSGNGRDGAVSGGTWTPGNRGGALLFNGTSDRILAGTAASLSGTTDFTATAWIRTTASGVIIQQRNGGFNGEYVLKVNPNGTLNFFIYGNSAYQFDFNSTTAVNDGEWHHVAAVRSGTSGFLSVDGVQAGTGRGPVRDLAPTIGVGIGADIRDDNKYFSGTLDDIRLYDVALSAGSILELATGSPDLTATAFDVMSDHLPTGQTDVTFTVRNRGTLDAGPFSAQIVWSENAVVGDADDVILPTGSVTFAGLAAGTSVTRTVSVHLDRSALFVLALSNAAVGSPVGTVSTEVSHLYLLTDALGQIDESDELNNSGQGQLIDGDDITYFPWDMNGNGQVEPLEALSAIQSIGTANPVSDFDGNGIVTPLEALSAIQRIGYVRIGGVVNDAAPASLPVLAQAAPAVVGTAQQTSPVRQTRIRLPVSAQAVQSDLGSTASLEIITPPAASPQFLVIPAPVSLFTSDDGDNLHDHADEMKTRQSAVLSSAVSNVPIDATFERTDWLSIL